MALFLVGDIFPHVDVVFSDTVRKGVPSALPVQEPDGNEAGFDRAGQSTVLGIASHLTGCPKAGRIPSPRGHTNP